MRLYLRRLVVKWIIRFLPAGSRGRYRAIERFWLGNKKFVKQLVNQDMQLTANLQGGSVVTNNASYYIKTILQVFVSPMQHKLLKV